jgi:vitamin B12/bleomycin/antimicrobial peptide transport system ATP-binding/permease protein
MVGSIVGGKVSASDERDLMTGPTTDQQTTAAAALAIGGLRLEPRVMLAFTKLASGFWTGGSARRAWGLTLGLITCLSLSVGVTLAMNHWHRWFFNALENKQGSTMGVAILVLGAIVATMAAIGVGIVWTRESLQVRWREWLTGQLMTRWLDGNRFYHLGITGTEPANPEYRIADDTRWATELMVDCAIGLFSAVVGATAFIGILWSVGGSLTLPFGQSTVTIPAYMVLAALLYGCCASTIMLFVGRPLVGSVVAKNEAEGQFRFSLMRLRDNAESVALSGGARGEHALASALYAKMVGRWLGIVRQHANLTWITNTSGPLVPIVPLIFATPKYLAGQLSLGEVMQLAAAFVQVQIAISWIVDNYNRIADWYASARRIIELTDACDQVAGRMAAHLAPDVSRSAAQGGLGVRGLVARDEAGNALSPAVSFKLEAGQQMLLIGPSGSGKTALVRQLAGIWPWGSGQVAAGARVMVLTQRPYVPATTLRGALLYPHLDLQDGQASAADTNERLMEALGQAGLAHLVGQLDDDVRLDRVLSSGDLQRLGIARVIVHRPDVAVIDEALSAFDDQTQRELLEALKLALPTTSVVICSQSASAVVAGRMRVVELARGLPGDSGREARGAAASGADAMRTVAAG